MQNQSLIPNSKFLILPKAGKGTQATLSVKNGTKLVPNKVTINETD